MKVPNITFKEYISLEDRTLYEFYLEYGKFTPSDVLKIGNFFDLPFGFVKDIQYYFNSPQGFTWQNFFEEVSKLKGWNLEKLTGLSIFDIQSEILFFKEQIETINRVENENLGHSPDADEINADLSRFDSYGAFIQFDKLAGGDLTKYEDIKKLDYSFCFTKLKLEADRTEYEIELNRIKANKKI